MRGFRDSVTRRGVRQGLVDKLGVAHTIGCGPKSTNGFVHRSQFRLKLAEAKLSIIKRAG